MDFNATPWSCQPFLHELSMMILGIVEEDVDQSFIGIHVRDGYKERDRA